MAPRSPTRALWPALAVLLLLLWPAPGRPPGSPLRLNESLAAPRDVDWDGDGEANAADEWIELVHLGTEPFALDGWQVDDRLGGGTPPYTFPPGSTIPAGGHLLLFQATSGIGLNNGGDDIHLLRPDGSIADHDSFGSQPFDRSRARYDDLWLDDQPPSPGAPNLPLPTPTSPPPSPSATLTAPPTPAATPTSTATARPVTPTRGAPRTVVAATPGRLPTRAPTGTATPLPASGRLRLAEFLPRPATDWDGDGEAAPSDEYIELVNLGEGAVTLAGLFLDDAPGGSAPFPLDGTLAAGRRTLYFRSGSGVALNDGGDEVRLIDGSGAVLDGLAYGAAAPDQAWQRDGSGLWRDDLAPSPGAPPPIPPPPVTPTASPSPTPDPTPTAGALPAALLLISEVLYDGTQSGDGDEFVELWNPAPEPLALDGWGLGDEESPGGSEGFYRFGPGTTIGPDSTLLVARDAGAFHARFGRWPDFAFRASSRPEVPLLTPDPARGRGQWALSDSGDEVILLDPHDRVVDRLAFRAGEYEILGLTGHDISAPAPRSLQPVEQWRGAHLNDWLAYDLPTPGRPLRLPPPVDTPLGPDLGEYRVAWGSLHAHSTYSDGSGPPPMAFAVARANGLHFMALSDHSHWYTEDESVALRQAAAAATEPGRFVALAAFEWTHLDQGHINVFGAPDDASRSRDDGATLEDFWTWLAARPSTLAHFNHPFEGQFDDFRLRPDLVDQVVGLEVVNGAGARHDRYEEAYFTALDRGWRLAALGNLDTESPDWGADGPLRTGLLLAGLDPPALFEALAARRAFATERAGLTLALRAGGVWMGGEIEPGPVTWEVLFADRVPTGLTLELLRDGRVVAGARVTASGAVQQWEWPAETRAGEHYLVRATADDGSRGWSSPIWIHGETRPPSLRFSEVLPAPRAVDWDGDGTADFRDEWIELYNPESRAVELEGWRLAKESYTVTLPAALVVPPQDHALLFRRDSDLALSNQGEHLRLVAPDGTVTDEVAVPYPGPDLSVSHCGGQWEVGVEPSPGEPCTPTPPATPMPITAARAAPVGRTVAISGTVSASGRFHPAGFYVQDDRAGLRVLAPDDLALPAEGARLHLTGTVAIHFGEPELRLADGVALRMIDQGLPPDPRSIAPGTLAEHGGLLVQVRGRVEGWSGEHWTLNDGVAGIPVYHDRDTGLSRPYLTLDEPRTVAGIVGWSEEGPRLMPRTESDLASGDGSPALLPLTGAPLPLPTRRDRSNRPRPSSL